MAIDDEEFYDSYAYDAEDEEVDSDVAAMEADDYDDDDDEGSVEEDYDKPRESPTECWAIKKEALCAAQQQDLSMVMNLFNIKQHHARALLVHYRWNRDRINDHLDRKGQDLMLREAGVVLQENNSMVSKTTSRIMVTCGVCFDDFSLRDVSTMDCGHSFCNGCWTGYFVAALDGGQKQIRCMEVKCPVICDEAVVQRLLGREHPAAAERFRDFLLQSYVDDNSAVQWCPSVPHCGRATRVGAGDESEPLCEVECPCGAGFCFRCAAPAHSPCPCAIWERWEAKGRGESENVKWLLANTKNCPKCFKPVIKEGGCNLVTCKCGQYLCWLCGGATGYAHTWTKIEGHSCNRFNEKDKKKVDDARRQLRRYEHYYERFQAHGLSYKAEHGELGPGIAAQVEQLESDPFGIKLRDSGWLLDAHRLLLGCRQVLSRSYVFAYYMFDEDAAVRPPENGSLSMAQRQALFEDYQEQVEGNVERLSQLLSRSFTSMDEEEILLEKEKAKGLIKVAETHCGKMYGCIQDELLPLLVEAMSIAGYQRDGPIKATELLV